MKNKRAFFGRLKKSAYICCIQNDKDMKKAPILESNEYFRVNSYYWQGMVYVAIEEKDGKTLCQIKGSKSNAKWIKTEQLSKTFKDFSI